MCISIYDCVSACVAPLKKCPIKVTYRKDEAVLEVGEFFIALLTAEHAILLVNHFLVAVLAGTGLVKAVFLTQVHYGSNAGVVVRL